MQAQHNEKGNLREILHDNCPCKGNITHTRENAGSGGCKQAACKQINTCNNCTQACRERSNQCELHVSSMQRGCKIEYRGVRFNALFHSLQNKNCNIGVKFELSHIKRRVRTVSCTQTCSHASQHVKRYEADQKVATRRPGSGKVERKQACKHDHALHEVLPANMRSGIPASWWQQEIGIFTWARLQVHAGKHACFAFYLWDNWRSGKRKGI